MKIPKEQKGKGKEEAAKASVIDATNLILGRLASKAAKHALDGGNVIIINCEKAIVTGDKKQIFDSYIRKFDVGQVNQGPYFPRTPDQLVRRTIRGMLPRKKPKGRAALERIKCYAGMPTQIKLDLAGAKTLPEASGGRIKKTSSITILELCKHIGYKHT